MVERVPIIDFVKARLAEDHQAVVGWGDPKAKVATVWTGPEDPGYTTVATSAGDVWIADGRVLDDARHPRVLFDPERARREVEYKRTLLQDAVVALDDSSPEGAWAAFVLVHMASVWADHPDYDPSWGVGMPGSDPGASWGSQATGTPERPGDGDFAGELGDPGKCTRRYPRSHRLPAHPDRSQGARAGHF